MTELEATITNLSHDGRGVARIDNKATFVSGALLGERVVLKYLKRHRNYDDAEVVRLIEASPDRVEPRCQHFGQCSGCSLQHMDPVAQIAAKQRVLAENFERLGKVTPASWLPPLSGQPWAYRRKGRFSVRYVAKKGRVLVGFRDESNTSLVADIARCEVIHPALGPKVGLLANLIDGMDAARDIPQVEFAAGDDTVALVFRHMAQLSDRDRSALVAFGQEHGFAVYLQPGNGSSVHPIWPEAPRLAFALPADDVELEFLPLDFVQVNAGMNQLMLARTIELLDLQPTDRVLDLFCGLGNFTLPMARHAAEVVGVEGEHGLVERAAANATRNGLGNVSFRVANLFDDQRSAPWASQSWDKILLDPPRAGADKVLEYLPRKGTHRIVYVSCHPGSLARDAGILVQKHGFKLVSAGVMDMFPHTAHVESIALFERG
jgi:23S rRNA (uracil1939-C5)-methyltransferase